jgi:abortive infection bacteriophage resistance protein
LRPLKRWLSITDQLELLQARGLHVDDRVAAMDYLERLGYYRLSGYWYPLRRIDEAASQAQGKPVRLDRKLPRSADTP